MSDGHWDGSPEYPEWIKDLEIKEAIEQIAWNRLYQKFRREFYFGGSDMVAARIPTPIPTERDRRPEEVPIASHASYASYPLPDAFSSPYNSSQPKLNYIAAFTAIRRSEDQTYYNEFHATLNATAPLLWKMRTILVRESSPLNREIGTPWNWLEDLTKRRQDLLQEENPDYLTYVVGLVNGCEFVVLHDPYVTGDLKFVRAIALAHGRKVYTLEEYNDLFFPKPAVEDVMELTSLQKEAVDDLIKGL